jgi:putative polyhydroxyalkanoate system protein
MPNLTMSIPHQLGRVEAKRRIEQYAAQMLQQYGHLLGQVTQRWNGDTLEFLLVSAGQSVTGQIIVEEQVVRVEIALPWIFTMLTGTVKQQVEQQGRLLLGHQP